MSKLNRDGPLAQTIITAVGALIGALFGDLLFVPAGIFDRPPTFADVAWALCGVSGSAIVGALLFSWAGKKKG
jgi:hypothetical protein